MNIQSIVSNLHQISNTTKWVVGGVVGLGSLAAIVLVARRVLADSPHSNTGQPGTTEGTPPHITASVPLQMENTHSNTGQLLATETGSPQSPVSSVAVEEERIEPVTRAIVLDLSDQPDCSDDTLATRLAEQPDLTDLNLSGCTQITTEGFLRIAQYGANLTHLNLSGRARITLGEVMLISTKCTKLISLNLKQCYAFGDAEVGCLKDLTELRELNLEACSGIQDKHLESIGKGCSKLTHIDLTACHQITGNGIRSLIEKCPDLTYVDVTECRGIIDFGLELIRTEYPNLTIERLIQA